METTWIRKVTKVHWAGVFLDRTEPVMPLHQRSDTVRRLFVRPLPSPQVMLRTNTFRGKIPFVAKR